MWTLSFGVQTLNRLEIVLLLLLKQHFFFPLPVWQLLNFTTLDIKLTSSIIHLDYTETLVLVLYCLWQGFGSHSYWSASFNFNRQCFYPLRLRNSIRALYRRMPVHIVGPFLWHPWWHTSSTSNDSRAEFPSHSLLRSWAPSSISTGIWSRLLTSMCGLVRGKARNFKHCRSLTVINPAWWKTGASERRRWWA